MGKRRTDWMQVRDEIIAGLREGRTVREQCIELGVDRGTAWGWLTEDPETEARYKAALRAFAANLAEEALQVARKAAPGSANSDRLLVDQLRWLAGKADPARYGDRQVVEHQGGQEVRVRVVEEVAPVMAVARMTEVPQLPAGDS